MEEVLPLKINRYPVTLKILLQNITTNELNAELEEETEYSETFIVVPEILYSITVYARSEDYVGAETKVTIKAPAGGKQLQNFSVATSHSLPFPSSITLSDMVHSRLHHIGNSTKFARKWALEFQPFSYL